MQLQGVSTRVPKDHEYWVYIMASASGTLYVGMTNDLGVRVRQHKTGDIEGFSKRYHCDRLVYYESYDWVHRAIGREKQLKGWRRSKKIALIGSKNPRWKDLSESWGKELLFRGQSIKDADEQLFEEDQAGTEVVASIRQCE
jgi:putative endonuclease